MRRESGHPGWAPAAALLAAVVAAPGIGAAAERSADADVAEPFELADDDGDGLSECQSDCNDGNASIWGVPGEVTGLLLSNTGLPGATLLQWSPATGGGTASAMVYDLLRSPAADDFEAAAICLESDDGPATTATDATAPAPGAAYFYLVRAQNACPASGTLGQGTAEVRTGRDCP